MKTMCQSVLLNSSCPNIKWRCFIHFFYYSSNQSKDGIYWLGLWSIEVWGHMGTHSPGHTLVFFFEVTLCSFASLWGRGGLCYGVQPIGESGGELAPHVFSAHVAVCQPMAMMFLCCTPIRIPRTYGGQTCLGLKIIMTNHFWITWVNFFNNSYFVFSS